MLLIGISTLCIALIPFFLVFLRVCDRIPVLKGVFEHLLLLQRLGPPQTPCRAFWHRKQTISPYTTSIVDTLFQISNHPQSLEKNSMHWVPIIHFYHPSSTCLRSLASVWIGLWTLFFSTAKPVVTILWIKWRPKQVNPIERVLLNAFLIFATQLLTMAGEATFKTKISSLSLAKQAISVHIGQK